MKPSLGPAPCHQGELFAMEGPTCTMQMLHKFGGTQHWLTTTLRFGACFAPTSSWRSIYTYSSIAPLQAQCGFGLDIYFWLKSDSAWSLTGWHALIGECLPTQFVHLQRWWEFIRGSLILNLWIHWNVIVFATVEAF